MSTEDDLSRAIKNLPFFGGDTTPSSPPDEPGPESPPGNLAATASHITRAGQRRTAAPPETKPHVELEADPRTAPGTLPAPAETDAPAERGRGGEAESEDELWEVIKAIRDETAAAVAGRLEQNPNLTIEARESVASAYVTDLIRSRVDEQINTRGRRAVWSQHTQQTILKTVLDGIFRLGRIQPLLEEPEVENIHVSGYDTAVLSYANGTKKRWPTPIAASDEDLIREINILATRTGNGARSFGRATPRLHLDLPGSARLAAVAPPVAPRPTIVIRIHRLVDVTLDDLVHSRMLTREAADFLKAAVLAGRSIVVSGFPGAGKTTFLRALAGAIPFSEKIVTIEMERELHLDRVPGRDITPVPLEYQPGGGDELPNGRRPGEITLEDLVYDTLRMDVQRFIVGEVRGPEIVAMMQAMQSGIGSLSTIHAAGTDDSIERMSSLMLSKGPNITPQYANRMIEQNVALVVQATKVTLSDGTPARRITEIAEILPGEGDNESRPIANNLFIHDTSTDRLVTATRPTTALLGDLTRHGFDPSQMFGN